MLIAHNWWALALRGALGIIVGLTMFVWPTVALHTLILIFGAYALCDGLFTLAAAWRRAHDHRPWAVSVLGGALGVVVGLAMFAWPAMAAFTLATLIAFWAIVTGILEIVAAVRLRRQITGEWLLALSGAASLLFGVAVLAAPILGALVIAAWFGAYAFIFGAMNVALALRLRAWKHSDSAALGSARADH